MILVSILFSILSFGEMKHDHGVGDLSIALANKEFSILFNIPAESIIGFEHAAEKQSDIKERNFKIEQFEKEILKLIKFEDKFGCKKKTVKSDIKQEGNHGEYQLTLTGECHSKMTKTSIKINFKDKYSKIKKINVNLLSDQNTQSLGLLKGFGEIEVQ